MLVTTELLSLLIVDEYTAFICTYARTWYLVLVIY